MGQHSLEQLVMSSTPSQLMAMVNKRVAYSEVGTTWYGIIYGFKITSDQVFVEMLTGYGIKLVPASEVSLS